MQGFQSIANIHTLRARFGFKVVSQVILRSEYLPIPKHYRFEIAQGPKWEC
jgi:hypothetical protein